MTVFTILICCFRKMGSRHLITFTIKALSNTDVQVWLAHFTHSASIFRNENTQRSLIRGCGTSIVGVEIYNFASPFIRFTFSVQAAKSLVTKLCGCACSFEPLLLVYAIMTKGFSLALAVSLEFIVCPWHLLELMSLWLDSSFDMFWSCRLK